MLKALNILHTPLKILITSFVSIYHPYYSRPYLPKAVESDKSFSFRGRGSAHAGR